MRRLPLIGAAIASALLLAYLVVWSGVSPLQQRGSDFSVDYVAAQLVRAGSGTQLYNQALEAREHATILPSGATFDLPFIAPPTAALLAIPTTVLGPGTAYRTWSLAQLALLIAALAVAARAAPWAAGIRRGDRWTVCLAAAATPATLVLLLMGQWDGLLALGLAGAYAAWRAGRPVAAGLAISLAFGLTKPHLALGLAVFLLARREWRAAAAAVTGAGVVAMLSLLVAGPGGVFAFGGAVSGAFSNTPPQSTMGLAGLVSSWLGSGPLTAALVAGGSLAALAGCALLGSASRRGGNLELALGGAVALSLLVAPHVLAHDLVLLAPAMVWCTAWFTDRASRTSLLVPLLSWLGFSVLVALDAGNASTAPPGRLVPLALAAVGIAALATVRSRGRVRRPQPAAPRRRRLA